MFDPSTGCVLWNGGLTKGGQKESNCLYGVFWDKGRRHSAHRWAAEHIHGFTIPPGYHVGHICPTGPDTLCIQHVEPQEPNENWKQRHDQEAARLSLERRAAIAEGRVDVPMHSPPDWLAPFIDGNEKETDDGCPF